MSFKFARLEERKTFLNISNPKQGEKYFKRKTRNVIAICRDNLAVQTVIMRMNFSDGGDSSNPAPDITFPNVNNFSWLVGCFYIAYQPLEII